MHRTEYRISLLFLQLSLIALLSLLIKHSSDYELILTNAINTPYNIFAERLTTRCLLYGVCDGYRMPFPYRPSGGLFVSLSSFLKHLIALTIMYKLNYHQHNQLYILFGFKKLVINMNLKQRRTVNRHLRKVREYFFKSTLERVKFCRFFLVSILPQVCIFAVMLE